LSFLLANAASLTTTSPRPTPTIQVGAWGDDASRNNLGVKTMILTHTYDAFPDTLDYFWVGDYLNNGAFIQFGYSLQIGTTCLSGADIRGQVDCLGSTEIIFGSDARWEWQYWPNRQSSDFYFQIGPEGSAGVNDTWHEYGIDIGPSRTYEFLLDGQVVADSNFTGSRSSNPVLAIAERSPATSNDSYPLGPVAFRGLAYFDGNSWRESDDLVTIDNCGTGTSCPIDTYGSSSLGENSFVTGSNIMGPTDGTLLWARSYVPLDVNVHPGARFYITSVSGTNAYNSSANVYLPKNMLAYISLVDTSTNTPGILGLIGAQDHFDGWEGAAVSNNRVVPILMDTGNSIRADWTTDMTVPLLLLSVFAAILIVAAGMSFLRWRK
ncbi:MAG TPA: hypothetical protein VLV18_11410, partial [Terriglobales bacterium]|nr:hypothetical protein [Terriglobales bacterium]